MSDLMYLSALVIIVIIVIVAVLIINRRRRATRRRLEYAIRSAWGSPREDPHPLDHVDLLSKYDLAADEDRLDPQTWHDLDMDSVFTAIDRTMTPIGAQCLHRILSTPNRAGDRAPEHEALCALFATDHQTRERVALALARVAHDDGWTTVPLLWKQARPSPVPMVVFRLLQGSLFVSAGLALFYAILWVPTAVLFGTNILIHFVIQRRMLEYYAPLRYLAALSSTVEWLSSASLDGMQQIQRKLRRDISTFRSIVRKSYQIRIDDPVGLAEFFRSFTLCEVTALYGLFQLIAANREQLKSTLKSVGALDAALSVASLRRGCEVCVPELVASPRILRAVDLRHPLLNDPVGNDCDFEERSVLIYGHNMSGKSTFLKTVAVNVILAQTINTVFARSYRGSRFRVVSCVDISDDLLLGKSYYLAEAEAVLRMLTSAKKSEQALLVFDELFRGTSPAERVATAAAVLDHLATRHLVLAATHDLEVLNHLAGKFATFRFDGSYLAGTPRFDYKLKAGMQESRGAAIELLSQLGYPPEVIQRARHLMRSPEGEAIVPGRRQGESAS